MNEGLIKAAYQSVNDEKVKTEPITPASSLKTIAIITFAGLDNFIVKNLGNVST